MVFWILFKWCFYDGQPIFEWFLIAAKRWPRNDHQNGRLAAVEDPLIGPAAKCDGGRYKAQTEWGGQWEPWGREPPLETIATRSNVRYRAPNKFDQIW